MPRQDSMKRRLSKEQKHYCIAQIQSFFLEERDEEIGMIAAERVLDFIAHDIAPNFYNLGLEDARKIIRVQSENTETELAILHKPLDLRSRRDE